MSYFRNWISRRIEKVIFILAAAIILIVLAILLILGSRYNPSNETEVSTVELETASNISNSDEISENILLEGDDSKNNYKEVPAVSLHEAAGENANSADEVVSGVIGINLDAAHDSKPSPATDWILITVFILSVAVNGCIALFILRHNRERIKLLRDKKFVEREDFQESLENFVTSVSKIGQELGKIKEFNENAVKQTVEQTNRVLTEIANQSRGHGQGIEKMMESFNRLNGKIEEQDKEITRYKEGYDTQNIKSSLAGYIKVRDRIQSYADNEKTSSNDLDKLLIIIESSIDNLGASEIEIKIGDNFYDEKYVGLTDNPEIIETDDPEKHHLIASIVKKGYEIIGQERNTTIRCAKLKIYKHEPKEN
jgi:hypothetical protein